MTVPTNDYTQEAPVAGELTRMRDRPSCRSGSVTSIKGLPTSPIAFSSLAEVIGDGVIVLTSRP